MYLHAQSKNFATGPAVQVGKHLGKQIASTETPEKLHFLLHRILATPFDNNLIAISTYMTISSS